MPENTNLKKDIKAAVVIGLIVVIICAAFFMWNNMNKSDSSDMAAVVSVGNDIYGVFLLSEYDDNTEYIYSMEKDDKPVHFVIKNKSIAFYDVDCPDKICEKSGFLSQENDTAVCMPNRVSVMIMSENELNDEMKSKIIEISK